MTLIHFGKIPIGRDKMKQRRRSGLLSPVMVPLENSNRKSIESKQDENIIYQILVNNEFLKNILVDSPIQKVIDCMHCSTVEAGDVLLVQGKINANFFISKSGTFSVSVNGKHTETFRGIRIFGEVSILHSAKASQTVKAVSHGEIWVLDCQKYKSLKIHSHIEKRDEIVNYLRAVPDIGKASENRLYQLCDILQEQFFPATSVLIKEGNIVDNFIVVTSGSATVLTRNRHGKSDKLRRGDFFGDYIFKKETVSLYTIIADPPGVECLLLPRNSFLDHFHDLDDFLHGAEHKSDDSFDRIELGNLKVLKTLGIGGFGRVELVQHVKRKDDIFALKLMKKHEINGQSQIEQVYSEKNLQMACDSEFIVRLYRTFRDSKFIYFLLEACMGGDLWNLLRRQRRKCFDTDSAKFYTGCIVEALGYLHARDIVYRDLKPENVMVASTGYLKLTDFGFAKKMGTNDSSFSFVGTAEYVSPELIQNIAHDKGVDYWALGVFIFELLVGKSPFRNSEHNDIKTYKAILKGIDFVTFPYIVSPRARNLIKKLCRPMSVDRLGCQKHGIKDVRNHSWFSKMDWDKLRNLELEPPIRIALNGRTDTRYFENFREDLHNVDVEDDFSTWDNDF